MWAYLLLSRHSLSSRSLGSTHSASKAISASAQGVEVMALNGVEVKQAFGLERGRSVLTRVGFILLLSMDSLKEEK